MAFILFFFILSNFLLFFFNLKIEPCKLDNLLLIIDIVIILSVGNTWESGNLAVVFPSQILIGSHKDNHKIDLVGFDLFVSEEPDGVEKGDFHKEILGGVSHDSLLKDLVERVFLVLEVGLEDFLNISLEALVIYYLDFLVAFLEDFLSLVEGPVDLDNLVGVSRSGLVVDQSTTSTFQGKSDSEKSSAKALIRFNPSGLSALIHKSKSENFFARPVAREPKTHTSAFGTWRKRIS